MKYNMKVVKGTCSKSCNNGKPGIHYRGVPTKHAQLSSPQKRGVIGLTSEGQAPPCTEVLSIDICVD